MNVSELLATKEREAILRAVIYRTEQFGVNQIAKELNLSKGLISKFMRILNKQNVVKQKKRKYELQNNVNIAALRLFLNLTDFNPDLFKQFDFVKSAGIYGSYAKGNNTTESDIDLWVLIEKTSEEKLANLTSTLKKKYSKINVLYLTKEKKEELMKKDALFYHSLIFGSLVIYGGALNEIQL